MLCKPLGFKTLAAAASSQLNKSKGEMSAKGNAISKIRRFCLSLKITTFTLFTFILISGFFLPLRALSVRTAKAKVR